MKKGFTIVELLATIAIVAILAVSAVIGVNSIIQNQRIRAATIAEQNIKEASLSHFSKSKSYYLEPCQDNDGGYVTFSQEDLKVINNELRQEMKNLGKISELDKYNHAKEYAKKINNNLEDKQQFNNKYMFVKNVGCYKLITVGDLIEEGLVVDNDNMCDKASIIVVYQKGDTKNEAGSLVNVQETEICKGKLNTKKLPVITIAPPRDRVVSQSKRIVITITDENKKLLNPVPLQYAWSTDSHKAPTSWTNLNIATTGSKKGSATLNVSGKYGEQYLWIKSTNKIDKNDNKISAYSTGPYMFPTPITLKFDSNGGTTCAPNKITVGFNMPYGQLCNNTSKTGYKPLGWFTEKDGGTKVEATTIVSNSANPQTLFMHWEPIRYTIAFNGNGSTSGTMSSMSMKYDEEKELTNNAYTRTGYEYKGWNTKSDGSGTNYANKQKVKNLTTTDGATVTMYARWSAKILTITLNNQAATSAGTGTIYLKYDNGWYSNSSGTTSISTITKPTKTGYIFNGYYTSTNGGGTKIIDETGKIVGGKKSFTTDSTIYASWIPIYTITLNNQSATSAGTTAIYEKYNHGWYSNAAGTTSITSITKPSRTGYTFGGYYTSTNGGGTQIIDANGAIKAGNTAFSANATIYAKWTANIYTITLNNQSATSAGTTAIYEKYATGWYSNSSATSAISTITKPSRTGYVFGGYYTSTNGGGTQIIDANGTIKAGNTAFTANATIYAKWTNAIFTITLNNQSATSAGTTAIYEKYATGWYSNAAGTSAISSITKPSRTGYTFGGYYTGTNGSGTQIINANGAIVGSNTAFSANATIYAKWTANIYTITLNNQSANTAGTTVIYEKYGTGWYSNAAGTSAISSITKPSKTGYVFGGYYTGTNGTGTQIINANGAIVGSNTAFSANATIYAKWTMSIFTITLNNQSATSAGTTVIYEKYGVGWYSNSGATSAISSITKPSRTGYTFGGYYTGTNGSGTQIINANGAIVGSNTAFSANATIYAKWIANVYTITLNNQSATTAGTTAIYEKYGTGWYREPAATSYITAITKPTKTGYTFGGYYTGTNGSGTQIINASGTIVAGNTTFSTNSVIYAQWIPRIFTITLNNQSATSAGTTAIYEKYATGWYSNSAGTSAISSITKPTKSGYDFGGYYTGTNGTGTQIINASGTIVAGNTTFSADTTIYAKWTASVPPAPAIYKITLNNQSATSAGTKTIYEKYGVGWYSNSAGTNSISSITKPAKTGNVFGGYYTSTGGGGTQIIDASGNVVGSNTAFSADTTIYAKWTPYVLKIKYNSNNDNATSCMNSSSIYKLSGKKIIKKSDSSEIIQTVNYGSTIQLLPYRDANNICVNYDFRMADKSSMYEIGSNKVSQTTSYSAEALASKGGCDLSKQNCTITVKVNWRKTYMTNWYYCMGGEVDGGDYDGNKDRNGKPCLDDSAYKVTYDYSGAAIQNDGVRNHTRATLKMKKSGCTPNKYYKVGDSSFKLNEDKTFSNAKEYVKYLQDNSGIPYLDEFKYKDIIIELKAQYNC